MRLICDTFAPGDGGGVPSASESGSVDLTLEVAAANPRRPDLRQLRLLLRAWDTRGLALAVTGRSQRFLSLDQAGREQFLLALSRPRHWSQTGTLRRAQGRCPAALLPPGVARHSWQPMGYSGPLGRRDDVPPPALTPQRATTDDRPDLRRRHRRVRSRRRTAAAVLAGRRARCRRPGGGGLPRRADFDGGEHDRVSPALRARAEVTAEGQIALLQGAVPRRRHRHQLHDVVPYAATTCGRSGPRSAPAVRRPTSTTAALDAVSARLGINTDHDRAVRATRCWSVAHHARLARRRRCPATSSAATRTSSAAGAAWDAGIGAKQSIAKTWLVDAAAAGARIYVGVACARVTHR